MNQQVDNAIGGYAEPVKADTQSKHWYSQRIDADVSYCTPL